MHCRHHREQLHEYFRRERFPNACSRRGCLYPSESWLIFSLDAPLLVLVQGKSRKLCIGKVQACFDLKFSDPGLILLFAITSWSWMLLLGCEYPSIFSGLMCRWTSFMRSYASRSACWENSCHAPQTRVPFRAPKKGSTIWSTSHAVCVKEDVRDLCTEPEVEALFRMARGFYRVQSGSHLFGLRQTRSQACPPRGFGSWLRTLSHLNKTDKLLHAHPTSHITSAFSLQAATAAAYTCRRCSMDSHKQRQTCICPRS